MNLYCEPFIYTSTELGPGYHMAGQGKRHAKDDESYRILVETVLKICQMKDFGKENFIYFPIRGRFGALCKLYFLEKDWKGRPGTFVSGLIFKISEIRKSKTHGLGSVIQYGLANDTRFLKHEHVLAWIKKSPGRNEKSFDISGFEIDLGEKMLSQEDESFQANISDDGWRNVEQIAVAKPGNRMDLKIQSDSMRLLKIAEILSPPGYNLNRPITFNVGLGIRSYIQDLAVCFWDETQYAANEAANRDGGSKIVSAKVSNSIRTLASQLVENASLESFIFSEEVEDDLANELEPYWEYLNNRFSFSNLLNENFQETDVEQYVDALETVRKKNLNYLEKFCREKIPEWAEARIWFDRFWSQIVESRKFKLASAILKSAHTLEVQHLEELLRWLSQIIASKDDVSWLKWAIQSGDFVDFIDLDDFSWEVLESLLKDVETLNTVSPKFTARYLSYLCMKPRELGKAGLFTEFAKALIHQKEAHKIVALFLSELLKLYKSLDYLARKLPGLIRFYQDNQIYNQALSYALNSSSIQLPDPIRYELETYLQSFNPTDLEDTTKKEDPASKKRLYIYISSTAVLLLVIGILAFKVISQSGGSGDSDTDPAVGELGPENIAQLEWERYQEYLKNRSN